MTIHVALTHETRYQYDRPIRLGPQTIRLRPTAHTRTPVLSYALKVEPAGHFLNWQQDPFGNFLARVVFPDKVRSFVVRVDLVADMVVHNPFDFFLEPEAEDYPFAYESQLKRELEPYLDTLPTGPALREFLAGVSREKTRTTDFLVALNQRVSNAIEYVVRMEPGIQTPEETLTLKRGSCRDSGWLLVQMLRQLGIAARFVSGYLIQLTPDVRSLDGPSGTTHDFTDLHAWAEAYLPGAGWVGLDPTSGLLAGEGHIPLACAPQALWAAPISGALDDCEIDFKFSMTVDRIAESPRVTKPYSDAEWHAIDAVGRRLDAEFTAHDVRVTIGGEPTFVSIDHPDGAEWNTAAIGPTKRALAADLIDRLRRRFAPDGLLHFGQGKWYPGEQLPRWAFSLYWRGDGKPLWRNPESVADEAVDYAPTTVQARAFCQGIARRLELAPQAVVPAYEDPWHFAAAERRLPENLDPVDNKLDDPMVRDRLARVFERGLGTPVGFVLPVQRWQGRAGERRWVTEAWSTRSKRLFVIPGESPVGYRLPLPSLPYLSPTRYPHVIATDPFEARQPLPEPDARRQPLLTGDGAAAARPDTPPMRVENDDNRTSVRTALTVEARDGRLNIFMPPVETVEDYLELVAAVEDTAAELGTPVHLEGYGPPQDPRLNVIKVTPDPGVIEVNIHPSGSWDDLVAKTTVLYEEARLARLGTEKFMLDGRHCGTGGGNHVVLGGATPADSPFLRRPDLLGSLITYWQNHPSLSYLFSGLFIGPTSQAPRIDEARHDSLYEMELALNQVPDPQSGRAPAPWLVDRIFRNLLIDVTGNTHRAEICIDKLYSPDSSTGRLGLVEFRAFEMPPHAQMSLVQQQLLLALVARFWKTPYRAELVRWGTLLNDRWMLPHYVWRDLVDVVAEMNDAGYPIAAQWFAPHFEFRFPRYGEVRFGDVTLELRQALEPWHVMGEEGAPGGTVRYVDSSLERLQVRVTGINTERYVVGCNGIAVPLKSTGTAGEFVGGVRFRAWRPAASLHPMIDVDAPLIFDLYDCWSGRAVAGCTYFVAHPGGRNFEHFPVNGYEAESRRLSRFHPFGHTPGPAPEPLDLQRAEFPHTVDLRWRPRD